MKSLYDKVKETFSKVCASGHLTIVTTSQLSIKMINTDGSSGSYDSGAHGILSPYLGDSYLPHTKAHRVMLCPEGPDTGFIKVLSSPKHPPGKSPSILEPYSIVNGLVV